VLEVFRIVTQQHVRDAFSGEGARLYGGRWNAKGMRVVYTASSRALAMLEMLVQDQPLRARYAIIPASIPASLPLERLPASKLPADWSAPGQNDVLRALGADWLRRARAAVLCVPSVVVPSEFNYLLNPLHADFARIKFESVEILKTDARIVRRLAHPAPPKRP
jgi:RES domain-containing protein